MHEHDALREPAERPTHDTPRVSVPESAQEQETAESRMEMRHRIATLAVGLERVAAHPDRRASFIAELAHEPIPDAARTRILRVTEGYVAAVERARKAERTLGLERRDIVTAGKMLFYSMTGFAPHGLVTAERREGYFVLTCSDPHDFGLAATAGMRTESVKYERAGGVYHRALPMLTHEVETSVIIRDTEDAADNVLTHERQHWINDALYAHFTAIERSDVPREPTSYETPDVHTFLYAIEREKVARNIKDEVLAYLREGRGGRGLETLTTSELYEDLFANDPSRWKGLVHRIAKAFDTHLALFRTRDSLGVIVAQLARAPLEKMPRIMEELGRYYAERWSAAGQAWSEDIVEAQGRLAPVVHPDVRDSVHTLGLALDRHHDLRHAAGIAALGSDGTFVRMSELAERGRLVLEAFEGALRQFAALQAREAARGARYPSIERIAITARTPDAGDAWEARAHQVGESIVIALGATPQEMIDAAYDEARKSGVTHRSAFLSKNIADRLHAATGHTFTIDAGEPFVEPRQFDLTIRQHASDTLPEIVYSANLYRSEG